MCEGVDHSRTFTKARLHGLFIKIFWHHRTSYKRPYQVDNKIKYKSEIWIVLS